MAIDLKRYDFSTMNTFKLKKKKKKKKKSAEGGVALAEAKVTGHGY